MADKAHRFSQSFDEIRAVEQQVEYKWIAHYGLKSDPAWLPSIVLFRPALQWLHGGRYGIPTTTFNSIG